MIAGWEALVLLVILAACEGTGPGDGDAPLPEQGVVALVRTLAGDRLLDAGVEAGGGADADPDFQSTTYFYGLSPGRAPIFGDALGFAGAYTAPEIQPEGLTATDLRFAPTGDRVAIEGSGEATLTGGLTMQFGEGVLALADDPTAALGRVEFTGLVVTERERAAVPADQQLLANDDQVTPMQIGAAFFVQASDPLGQEVAFVEEQRAAVSLTLPAGDPLFDAGTVRVAAWSRNRTYWVAADTATLDPVARTASFEVGIFGWFALVVELDARPCVDGELRAGGAPLAGAELRVARPGGLGLDRVTSDEDGRVCVPVGGPGSWSALGYDAALQAMYTGSGSEDFAAGFVLALDTWADDDGDLAFAGPGGDCDDADPAVSPNVANGDGSWCGSDW
jgi:hypothetical protein